MILIVSTVAAFNAQRRIEHGHLPLPTKNNVPAVYNKLADNIMNPTQRAGKRSAPKNTQTPNKNGNSATDWLNSARRNTADDDDDDDDNDVSDKRRSLDVSSTRSTTPARSTTTTARSALRHYSFVSPPPGSTNNDIDYANADNSRSHVTRTCNNASQSSESCGTTSTRLALFDTTNE